MTKTYIKYNKVTQLILKYVFGLGGIVLASLASILGISPFGYGAYLGLIFSGLNVFILSPAVFSVLIFDFSFAKLISSCFLVLICISAKFIRMKNKELYIILVALIANLGSLGNLFFYDGLNGLKIIVSCGFSIGFMYLVMIVAKPIFVNKLKYKFLEAELVCAAVVTAVCSIGASKIVIFNFPLVALLGSLAIFLALYIGKSSGALVTALCVGLGAAIFSSDVSYIAEFAFIALVSCIFFSAPRIIYSLSGAIGYVMLSYFFNINVSVAPYFVLCICLAGIIFTIIPRKLLDFARDYFFGSHSISGVRYMVNRNKQEIGGTLEKASQIFKEMGSIMRKVPVSAGGISGLLMTEVCLDCDNFDKCKNVPGLCAALDDVTEEAASRGKVTVSGLPFVVSNTCVHLAKIVAAASGYAESFKQIKLRAECDNSARQIVSKQLEGVSGVLESLAKKALVPIEYDGQMEKNVIEELNYNGIVCSEVLVSADAVTMIVRTECINKEVIERQISKLFKISFTTEAIDDTIIAGYSILTLCPSPKFDVVFGACSIPKRKGDKCGDTHSFIKISSSKFMIALCDGMGSGEQAQASSETAIGLVESFYKAGFSSELVLISVNKFLTLYNEESFSALDICVLDLNSGVMDCFKFGSPASYIKSKSTVEKIDGKSLPLGALTEVKPEIIRATIKSGDMLVLTSDGVADCYEGDRLSFVINSARSLNPQVVADSILENSLSVSGGVPKDDASVVVARLFERF